MLESTDTASITPEKGMMNRQAVRDQPARLPMILAVIGAVLGGVVGAPIGYYAGYLGGEMSIAIFLGVFMFAGAATAFGTKFVGIGKWYALASVLCGLGFALCFCCTWPEEIWVHVLGGICGAILSIWIGAGIGFCSPLIVCLD